MKLVLFSMLIALTAATGMHRQDDCCPCTGRPGSRPGRPDHPDDHPDHPDHPDFDLIEFVVQEPDTSKGDPIPVIQELIKKLIRFKIIDEPTATRLLVTFKIPGPNQKPIDGKPLTPDEVQKLPIHGKPDFTTKFITQLIPVLNRPNPTTLIRPLLELVLNNKVVPLPEIYRIFINFRIVPNVQIVVPPEKQNPSTGRPGRPTKRPHQPHRPDQPDSSEEDTGKQFTKPAIPIKPGKPSDSTVTVNQVLSRPDGINLIIYLLKNLMPKKIIDRPTADRIIITFFPEAPPKSGAQPFKPDEPIKIGGRPKPKDKFVKVIVNLLKNPKSTDNVQNLIKIISELLIDNGVTDFSTILKIIVKFGVGAKVSVVDVPEEPKKPKHPKHPKHPKDPSHPEEPEDSSEEPDDDESTFDVPIRPGQPCDSTVTITDVPQPEKLPNLITVLLKILVDKKIIDKPTADRILITFRIPKSPGSPFSPESAKPIEPTENIPTGGNAKPKNKFVTAIIKLIKNPKGVSGKGPNPDFVKTLLEFVIDTGIIDLPTAVKITVTFGIPVKVQSVPDSPDSDEPEDFPEDEIHPGQPCDSTVTITGTPRPEKVTNLITMLLKILVDRKIIDKPTANKILITFRIPASPGSPFNPNSATPISPNDNVPTGGNQRPKNKFITAIINLVKNPKGPSGKGPGPDLIKFLLEFLIDNGAIDPPTAVKITITFGITVQIEAVPDSPAPNRPDSPEFSDVQIVPGEPSDSTITITNVLKPDNLPKLIIRILKILVDKKIVDVPTANRILITFRIQSVPNSPFNPNSAKPFSPDDDEDVPIKGSPNSKEKFVTAIIKLIKNPKGSDGQGIPINLVKILLEFVIDNGIFDLTTATKIAVTFGLTIKITSRPDNNPTGASFPSKKIRPGELGVSTVTIQTISQQDVPTAVNGLLDLLVRFDIIDVPTANCILVTFRIPGRLKFNPDGARPLSSATIKLIVIKANDEPKKRFIDSLIVLIGNQQPSTQQLITILITILLDNGNVDLQTATMIMTVFRIAGQIKFQPTPAVKEPSLVKGNPPAGMQIDSTVTINSALRDVKPLVKRLIDLCVQNKLFQQNVGSSFLTMFGIQTGGAQITATAQLTIGGTAASSQKFLKNLTPMLGKAADLNAALKILTELLVDNAVADMKSAVQFLVAYGVGSHINVRYTGIKAGGKVNLNLGGDLNKLLGGGGRLVQVD